MTIPIGPILDLVGKGIQVGGQVAGLARAAKKPATPAPGGTPTAPSPSAAPTDPAAAAVAAEIDAGRK